VEYFLSVLGRPAAVTQLSFDGVQPHADALSGRPVGPLKTQLLKWIGNKQRFAHEICSLFPTDFCTYYEPFLGSGAVLGTLSPRSAVASDVLEPLVGIWQTLRADPATVKRWYRERWFRIALEGKIACYEAIKADYNRAPNPADLLFISRACYGGVVRFRRRDGAISTPCGAHDPVSPEAFDRRVDIWHQRTRGTSFFEADFESVMDGAQRGDLIYCDPPYTHTQAILYGAQGFDLARLLATIERCKGRGVYVAMSIDGTKKSGDLLCDVPIPNGLFEREAFVNCGRSMLRRFQMRGESLESEVVRDRLLLTY
jgi:DNA adenine methylase